ncbi:uncharacterized protein M6B38_404785 [Iris pallida]|uniref:Protein kinase domain-containing protein n=2 Tax=Iris pallida TaxID=29817 RepID=A0AAX6FRY5_IRIPA|nr:uncharacterized protein M6B38_404785 [Iris pallida]
MEISVGDEAISSSRAKFLCSFGGSILPRPLDGRLRYVGGETRIVSVPRDVSYEDLLSRMRDLFEGVSVIKYQQPDEDLDALVSVVNDDDVVNMMEEYDKLLLSTTAGEGGGAGGFTRLRIFLFSRHGSDPDLSSTAMASSVSHFDAADERETERRYVDALNSLVDPKPPSPTADVGDPYLDLRRLNIPHPPHEAPWSPAYFSPGRDFNNSPSSSRYHDDHQSPTVMESVVWLPPGAVVQDKAGFPGNLGHSHNVFEGGGSSSGVCEHCRMVFQRPDPRILDPRWNQPGSCAECYRTREPPFYNDSHAHDRGWLPNHYRIEDPRMHLAGNYVVDCNVVNVPYGHGNFYDGHDESRYARAATDLGSEVVHPGNQIPQYGADHLCQVPQNLPPIHFPRRKAQVTVWQGSPYDSPIMMPPNNGFMRDGSPRISRIGVDDPSQSPWSGQNGGLPQKYYGVDDHNSRVNPNIVHQEGHLPYVPDLNPPLKTDEQKEERLEINVPNTTEVDKVGDPAADASAECLTYLPELIASVKKAVLETAEEVKAKVDDDDNKKKSLNEIQPENGQAELDAESYGDGDQKKNSKIEPTTAEAEALAKGLQTIRNDDLEEIRELGSGTYGSVFHGKWKGSDVAIKRIKASCFAGKPSERERLIADFWKEALILSSLHHPNVVAFYGVVRDGPDGSLATVTEFMVNGSLKQFLQKKDRTIDRRKRLIIAMDAAFGMEYLHGKNIVHFDLKCENLLVNMRDPQRPICKIGDLGLSKVKQHTLVSGGVRGTLPWMAPELLSGKSSMVTEKIDVYSFGIVMWELLTGEEPYADMRCASIIGGIVNNTLRPQVPTWCDPEWKSLMESCWASDPGERPSFSEISQN